MRAHFVNENVGGHATMHLALRDTLDISCGLTSSFYDVPAPTWPERMMAGTVPGLGRYDADLQPLRAQLVRSAAVRRHLRALSEIPDVLHVYTHNVGLLSGPLLRRQPTVVSLDATNVQNAYRLPQRHPSRLTPAVVAATKPLEQGVYDSAVLVVAQSEWAAGSLRRDYHVPDERIRVVPFGISVPPTVARVEGVGLPRVTFVGRSMDRKGGWQLLRVWRQSLRQRCRLTLVTLERVPVEPGLEVRNDIRPGDGQMARLLSATDVFAFPTELDTFGYAAVEAMAAAVPVVATFTAALPEVVDDGTTGILVATRDDEALRQALLTLLDDPDRGRRMGEAGRRRMLERFDAKVTTPALVSILQEAATMTPPPAGHHRADRSRAARTQVRG